MTFLPGLKRNAPFGQRIVTLKYDKSVEGDKMFPTWVDVEEHFSKANTTDSFSFHFIKFVITNFTLSAILPEQLIDASPGLTVINRE